MSCTCVKKESGKGKGKVKGYVVTKLCPECIAQREVDAVAQAEQKEQEDAQFFLVSTDWKVVRHRDQVALEVTTSLTNEEYVALLNERQAQRDVIA